MSRSPTLTTVLTLALLSVSCQSPAPATAAPTSAALELRSYDVPEAHQKAFQESLRGVLSSQTDSPAYGRLSSAPGGQVLVLATPRVHQGVGLLVESLRDLHASAGVKARSVRFTYWFVGARSGTQSVGSQPPAELKHVLARITEAQGPLGFELIERLEIASATDNRLVPNGWTPTDLSGRRSAVKQTVLDVGEEWIHARTELTLDRRQSFGASIALRPGQHLVMGQSDFPIRQDDEADHPDFILYIVKAELL
ncbi:MAG: hypothetical protein AAF533_18465 [Acidobacteriota bacterium]